MIEYMKKGLILVVLFIVFMAVMTGCLNLISAPNTIENILGVVILAVTMIGTICLIKSQIQKDDRGENREG